MDEYGIEPIKIIDLKALSGDASDNIPGVPSIGEKTATKIITEYHSIEEAYAHADERHGRRVLRRRPHQARRRLGARGHRHHRPRRGAGLPRGV